MEKESYVFSSQKREIYYGYTNNMAVRKSLFDKLGPFPEVTRGGDTLFVHRVVDSLSYSSICYVPRASVCHLEINNLWDYYHKRVVRGGSNQKIVKLASFKPLNNKERIHIFRSVCKRTQTSWMKRPP